MSVLVRYAVCVLFALGLFSITGCTPTAVSNDTRLSAGEGLVLLRVVDLGTPPITRFTVESVQTGEEFPMRAIRFGQVTSYTYVGRLPQGRYRPKQLTGFGLDGYYAENVFIPLRERTGEFHVEAGRVTQLGTMVYLPLVGRHATGKFPFELHIDPTPVPVDELITSRFTNLAQTALGKPTLGWADGTLPQQPKDQLQTIRRAVRGRSNPYFAGNDTAVIGGALGTIAKLPRGDPSTRHAADTGTRRRRCWSWRMGAGCSAARKGISQSRRTKASIGGRCRN